MKNIRKLFLLILVLSSLFLSATTKEIYAQSELNLTVSPPIAYLHAPQGTSSKHTIILENSGDSPITVLPTLVDFTTDGKSGKVILTNQLTFPYVSLGVDNSVTEVTIPPQKKAQLTLYIDIPNDAEEKEYPLTVLFFSKDLVSSAPGDFSVNGANATLSNSQVSGAIGSNLVVLVAKQNTFEKLLSVLDLQSPKIIDSFQEINFTPLVQNNSFGSITASGSAKIVNWRKQTIAEFQIYPDIILGHNSRELRALLSDTNPEKPEVANYKFKPSFIIGPYQIIVTLTNDTGTVTQYVEVFYALPIALIVVGLSTILISVYFSKKNKETQTK